MKTPPRIWKTLSKREAQVAKLLMPARLDSHEIGVKLGISVKTVDSHRLAVLSKLRLRNNAQLSLWGLRKGLIR